MNQRTLPYVGACIALCASVVLAIAWEWKLAPLRPGGSWLILKALPLALAVPGIFKRRIYTYQWLSLLVWIYVCEGVVRGLSDRTSLSRTLGWIEAALATALFVFVAWYARSRPSASASPPTT